MKTILVADDERMLRRALFRVLTRAGYSVLLAEDGGQAVEVFRENAAAIDLVVLDMNMPVLDGPGAFAGIRGLDPSVRIVMATGESASDVRASFDQEQPLGILQKPFSLAGLVRQVEAFLS
jgi:two-component system, cell cycle sensor histidine kinase and response regulator CckA